MSPQQAADAYRMYMNPFAGRAYLGAPAVTNGPSGLPWLKQFFSLCTGCHIDFIPIHWYDKATNVPYFKSYIEEAKAAAGSLNLWITEVCSGRLRRDSADRYSSRVQVLRLSKKLFCVLYCHGLIRRGMSLTTRGTGVIRRVHWLMRLPIRRTWERCTHTLHSKSGVEIRDEIDACVFAGNPQNDGFQLLRHGDAQEQTTRV